METVEIQGIAVDSVFTTLTLLTSFGWRYVTSYTPLTIHDLLVMVATLKDP